MSKQDVTIRIDNIGDMVQESCRAYCHSGAPSSLLMRVLKGVCEAQLESEQDSEDRTMLTRAASELSECLMRIRALEPR